MSEPMQPEQDPSASGTPEGHEPEPASAEVVPVAPVAQPATLPAALPTTSSNAVIALVLAIASWLVCPLALAIVALVFANKADHEVAASGGRITAGGLGTAAKIVAWVNIGVSIAVGVILVLITLIALVAGGLEGM